MPIMSAPEIEEFLARPGVLLKVAVVRSDGTPLVTPIWFINEDNAIYFTPREKSEWFACLRAGSKVALCIDDQNHPYPKLLLEGAPELVFDIGHDDEWRDLYRRISERYVNPEQADAYITNTIDQPRGLYRLKISESNMRTWRMPIEGEAGEGIWHDRYYKPGTKFKTK
jgi:nitroimidazol reductase NimA-like FMN-containing flavoprotein (pyridoxamine 5'-phosphate oxidase superfamily)